MDIEAVLDAMANERALMHEEDASAELCFKVELIGGPATQRRTGHVYIAAKGQAKGDEGEGFCRIHEVGMSFWASYREYDRVVAGVLCRGWCHKMQYYYDLEQNSGEQYLVFTAEHRNAYQGPTKLTLLREQPNLSQRILGRLAKIDNLFSNGYGSGPSSTRHP